MDIKEDVALANQVETIEQQAQDYYKAGRYQKALNCYEKALKIDSAKADLYVGKGNCLRKLEHYDKALQVYKKAFEFEPQSVAAYNGFCYTYIKQNNLQKALDANLQALSLDPYNAAAYNGKGQILRLQKDLASALEAFEKAIQFATNTDNLAGFFYNKGLTLFDLHQHEKALEAYYQALRLGLNKPTSHDLGKDFAKSYLTEKSHSIAEKGNSLLQIHDYKNAQQEFDLALHFNDGCVLAWLGKGEVFFALKHFQDAEYVFNKTLQLLPENPNLWDKNINALSLLEKYGKILLTLEKYEEALRVFRLALSLQFRYLPALIGCGNALFGLEEYEEALRAYNEVFRFQAGLPQALITQIWERKGHALYALGRETEALHTYTNAIFYDTTDVKCFSNAGEILARQGVYTEAQKRYQQALQLDPTLLSAQLGLGDVQMLLKQDVEVAEAYRKAIDLLQGERNPEALWLLIDHSLASSRPAHIQLELVCQFVSVVPQDVRILQICHEMGARYQQLFDPQSVSAEQFQANVQKLAHILTSLPGARRQQILEQLSSEDRYTVYLLINLAPFAIAGLGSLAQQLAMRLKPEFRTDDLFTDFYLVLDSYGVSPDVANWLYAQILVSEQKYADAQPLLADLAEQRPTLDILWLYIDILEKMQPESSELLHALRQFIEFIPDKQDKRIGEARERIGQFYEKQHDYLNAIRSYEEAEVFYRGIGQEVSSASLLLDYRAGRWEKIPDLDIDSHFASDFAFPPIVVIDLESEYRPDAPLGSTVFEVGAVCFKGGTEIHHYRAIIQRDFISSKVAQEQDQAKPQAAVIEELQAFIEQCRQSFQDAIIVGHNLQAFDAPHLRAMGLSINDDQIIDTFTFARLLHPDSIHHNLSLLCKHYGIPLTEAHHALPDARACACLLYKLGNELVEHRTDLLAGFRAFMPVGSAFDRAVLQPRKRSASPGYAWELDPTPNRIHALPQLKDANPPSPGIISAIENGQDLLLERFDPQGTYASQLPTDRRAVVTVGTRNRLERLLAAARERTDLFVLPDPRTLLCPQRLREFIEHEDDLQIKLTLFCLYQAGHNHDARTLYPLRLPPAPLKSSGPDEATSGENQGNENIQKLKRILLAACCANDSEHAEDCIARQAVSNASDQSQLLLATHESFLHQSSQVGGDLLIVDDLDDLQMHFAEYLARRVTSQDLFHQSPATHQLLNACISSYAKEHRYSAFSHERLPLSRIKYELTRSQDEDEKDLLARLKELDRIGHGVATTLEEFLQANSQQVEQGSGYVHAYWLELGFVPLAHDKDRELEQWGFYGIHEHISQAFQRRFWQPFRQHILCGTAISLGQERGEFLRRFFGLAKDMPFLVDERTPAAIIIPDRKMIRPASFLARRSWAENAGSLLYRLASSSQAQTIAVTLSPSLILEALAVSFDESKSSFPRQVLSPHLGWGTTKIGNYLNDESKSSVAFIPPRLRRVSLDEKVDIEISGPLHFLNQQDPLVAAQMCAFTPQGGGSFTSYLLPQALLELKARTASQAGLHIILDSALHDKMYRDEVSSLFGHEITKTLPMFSQEQSIPDEFSTILKKNLEGRGLSVQVQVSNEELISTLHTYWGERASLRKVHQFDQEAIIKSVLAGKDQLVLAATGGGKSLCFQLPAILHAQDLIPRVTLVISPLIALMQDQVKALNAKGIFSAICLNSMLSPIDRTHYLQGVRRGDYSIIYVAPEQVYSATLRKALGEREIGLIAVDEAHCVSQWGHDFRTAYFKLKDWIALLITDKQRAFPLLALTATARSGHRESNEQSTIRDIIEKLELKQKEEEVKQASPDRPELKLRVERIGIPCPACGFLSYGSKTVRCANERCCHVFEVMEDQIRSQKIERLRDLLSSGAEGGLRKCWDHHLIQKRQRGIIYCRETKEAEKVCEDIRSAIPGLDVEYYHGKQSPEDRQDIQRRFTNDDADRLDMVVATNAFGMGVDVRRLGFIIHFDVPATLEAYYQEVGRAGRNGRDDDTFTAENPAQCILLFHESDLDGQRRLHNLSRIEEQEIELVYQALCKIRGSQRQEILAQPDVIAYLTGFDKNKDKNKIEAAIYYLEQHTLAHGERLLARRENTTRFWQIKFEQGYLERINNPSLSLHSKQLADVFCHTQPFQLNEECPVIVDSDELMLYLGWDRTKIDAEKRNLVNRGIICESENTLINWHKSSGQCYAFVDTLIQNIRVSLSHIDKLCQHGLRDGKIVEFPIQSLTSSEKLNVTDVPINTFLAFLDALNQNAASDLRLFTKFTKNSPETYQLQLIKMPDHHSLSAHINAILRKIKERLCQPIYAFGVEKIVTEKQHLIQNKCSTDLVTEIPDRVERQQLHQALHWLELLGLLDLPQVDDRGITMRIAFLQDNVSPDQIKIDLTTLRRVERYGERKLKLMHRYALGTDEERRKMLHDYFFGQEPLIAPFEPRADLTEEQKELVTLSDGYHLIQAPAGSGKSTVLQEHIRYLVEHLQVPNERILVTAHQHGAIERLNDQLKSLQHIGKPLQTKTLSSVGEGIFRANHQLLVGIDGEPYYRAEKLPGTPKSPTGEKGKQKEFDLISEALSNLYKAEYGWIWEIINVPVRIGTYGGYGDTEKNCYEAISLFRSRGIFPTSASYASDRETILRSIEQKKDWGWLHRDFSLYYAAYIAYQLLQRERGEYTFDDQILFALAILRKHPEVVENLKLKYEHVIIDEFQDLKPAGAELLCFLSHKYQNVLAVGDRTQRILMNFAEEVDLERTFELVTGRMTGYQDIHTSFVDIDLDDIFAFSVERASERPSVKTHTLTTNFRSSQEILDFAQAIPNLPPLYQQKQRAWHGYRRCKPAVICMQERGVSDAESNGNLSREMLFTMVDAALHYIDQLPPEDTGCIALLASKSEYFGPIQTYLQRKQYPFAILKHEHRYHSEQAKRYLTYLRLIQDRSQTEAAEFLLQWCLSPRFKSDQVDKLKSLAERDGQTLLDAALDEEVGKEAGIKPEQLAALHEHVKVIQRYTPENLCEDVWPAIKALFEDAKKQQGDEPAQAEMPEGDDDELLQSEASERDDMKSDEPGDLLPEIGEKTIREALQDIEQFISFVEEHKAQRKLIVATIDSAKSQDFDTVFLLGADQLFKTKTERRWYVSVTRAKRRFFALVKTSLSTDTHPILSRMKKYYDVMLFRG